MTVLSTFVLFLVKLQVLVVALQPSGNVSSFSGPETPFSINVSDDKISLLKHKLEFTTFPDELEDAGWTYGSPLNEVKRLVSHWQNGYDWRKHEVRLNELPNYKREIVVDGFGALDIHYVHKKSNISGAIPLLFVHGWPGSFMEVVKILPLLTSPDDAAIQPAFHVVAPSLPGYGFSSAPKQKGSTLNQYAEVGHKLMMSLGYEQYVTQGGDWGGFITHRMALLYGHDFVKAWHTNLAVATRIYHIPTGSFATLIPANEEERAAKERSLWFENEGRGYDRIQSTQPQTLGYALADSPVGLLAWIYEKLHNWTDHYPWEDDEVLTWVSIYYFSEAGPAASLRIYYESNHEEQPTAQPSIPLGISLFPCEIFAYAKAWLYDPTLVFLEAHGSGGHFAAYEKPVELVNDLRKMFGKDGPAYSVISA